MTTIREEIKHNYPNILSLENIRCILHISKRKAAWIQKKKYLPTHVFVKADVLPKDSCILLEHIRAIDKTRLRDFIGELEGHTMKQVNRAIRISLAV